MRFEDQWILAFQKNVLIGFEIIQEFRYKGRTMKGQRRLG
jgi:hypothetical protein